MEDKSKYCFVILIRPVFRPRFERFQYDSGANRENFISTDTTWCLWCCLIKLFVRTRLKWEDNNENCAILCNKLSYSMLKNIVYRKWIQNDSRPIFTNMLWRCSHQVRSSDRISAGYFTYVLSRTAPLSLCEARQLLSIGGTQRLLSNGKLILLIFEHLATNKRTKTIEQS